MPSFKSTVLAVAAVLVASVNADYYVAPDSVPLSLRKNWCQSERSTCPIICQQTPPHTTLTNTCDPETLTYGCVCGDGLQPNVSEWVAPFQTQSRSEGSPVLAAAHIEPMLTPVDPGTL